MTLTNRMAVAFLAALLIAAAWWPASQNAAVEHSEAGLKRALAMYAVARGLNAVISVAQGTQFTGQFVVGVVIAAGQALDPINDLVEQFSAAMLMAAAAFGLQILLIKIGAHWVLPLLLSLAIIAWFSLWWRRGRAPSWLVRILVVLVLARFAVPMSALASEAVYRGVMAVEYSESEKVIRGNETAGRTAGNQPPDKTVTDKATESSWWSWPRWDEVKKVPDDLKDAASDLTAIVADMKRNAQKFAEHMVKVTVVFLLQTLILPLLFLWLLIALARHAVSGASVSSMLSDQRRK